LTLVLERRPRLLSSSPALEESSINEWSERFVKADEAVELELTLSPSSDRDSPSIVDGWTVECLSFDSPAVGWSCDSISAVEGTGGISPLSLLFRAFFFGNAEVFLAGVEDADEVGESAPSSTTWRRAGGNGDLGIAFEKGEPGCLRVSLINLGKFSLFTLEPGQDSTSLEVFYCMSASRPTTTGAAYDLPLVARLFAILSGLARLAGLDVNSSPRHTCARTHLVGAGISI